MTLSLSASADSLTDQMTSGNIVPILPLLHRVDSAIRKSPHLVGRHLVLETRNGAVVLRGTVDSFFEKQMAQEALRDLDGITAILNQLEVAYGKRK
ncbi:MAG: BON domain-containing protein [Pirellulaceae bacterium]|nr:BON domain-containing protein [Pirellulaceae bacterium]